MQALLQLLRVTRRLLIEDDEIDAQIAPAPEHMRRQQLLHQREVIDTADAYEEDGVVSRDPPPPEAGLAKRVGRQRLVLGS